MYTKGKVYSGKLLQDNYALLNLGTFSKTMNKKKFEI